MVIYAVGEVESADLLSAPVDIESARRAQGGEDLPGFLFAFAAYGVRVYPDQEGVLSFQVPGNLPEIISQGMKSDQVAAVHRLIPAKIELQLGGGLVIPGQDEGGPLGGQFFLQAPHVGGRFGPARHCIQAVGNRDRFPGNEQVGQDTENRRQDPQGGNINPSNPSSGPHSPPVIFHQQNQDRGISHGRPVHLDIHPGGRQREENQGNEGAGQ